MVNDVKTHIGNIGRLIETMESDIRSHMNELYILKTREIINGIRSPSAAPKQSAAHVGALNAAVLGHGKTRKTDSEI